MPHDELIITESTRRKLELQLTEMRTVQMPEVREAIKKAREYGDLSENFEYQAARQSQGILNGKIAEIEAVLERSKVVEDGSAGGDTVVLGAIVKVQDVATDDEWEVTIVDASSADPINDRISVNSPIGQALKGKKVGDVAKVALPDGTARYKIINLRHE